MPQKNKKITVKIDGEERSISYLSHSQLKQLSQEDLIKVIRCNPPKQGIREAAHRILDAEKILTEIKFIKISTITNIVLACTSFILALVATLSIIFK